MEGNESPVVFPKEEPRWRKVNLGLHFRPSGRKPLLPKCAGGHDGSHTGTGALSTLCMRCDLSGRGLRGEGGGRHREADPGDLPSSVKLLLVGSED